MTGSVPELRLSDFTSGDAAARVSFREALFASLSRWGFVILADHNVPTDLLDRAYTLSAALFDRPEGEKHALAGGLRGYTPFGVEHALDSRSPDLKEFWQIGREPTPEALAVEPLPPNVCLDQPAGFRETFAALHEGLDQTGRLLLSALAPNWVSKSTGSRRAFVSAPPSSGSCTIPPSRRMLRRAPCALRRMRTSISLPSWWRRAAQDCSFWTATAAGSPWRPSLEN